MEFISTNSDIFTSNQYPECYNDIDECVKSELEDCDNLMEYVKEYQIYKEPA